MVQLGAEGIANEIEVGLGGERPAPGTYVVAIHDVKEEIPGPHSDKIIVEFRIIGGQPDGQEGRTFTKFFATSPKAIPFLQRLALSIGLIQPGDPMREVTFVHAEDANLVVTLVEDAYTNKAGVENKGVTIDGMNMWSLNNPEVARFVAAVRNGSQKTQPAPQRPVQKPATPLQQPVAPAPHQQLVQQPSSL